MRQNSVDKKLYLVIMLAVLVLILGIYVIQITMNNGSVEKAEDKVVPQNIENNVAEGNELTAWKIIKMTDWLLWPFILITTVGIMLIVYRALCEHQEKSRAQVILQKSIKPNEIRRFIQVVRGSYPSRLARIMRQIISTFNKTKQAEPIGADVNQFLLSERESFETFNRVTGFLSDSAGALGLLGTVWGIFQTFHAGKLDGPTILQGMSISLVTTLVGLIISLALNMGATYVFALFNDQLKLLSAKAEELRQALLTIENKINEEYEDVNEGNSHIRIVDTDYQPPPQKRARKPFEIPINPL